MNTKHTGDHRHRTEVHFERMPGLAFAKTTAYFATCDCGWVGREMVSRRDAESDANEHACAMAGE
jgi:hypothetical protein